MSSPRAEHIGLAILLGFALVALFGPLVVQDPTAFVAMPHQPPSRSHWLGTTGQGQDVFSQWVVGARTTLLVGFATGAAIVALGALIGGAAGYARGRTDAVLSLLVQVFLLIPGLPLMVVIAAWLPPGPWTMTAVLTVTGWAWNARVLRAQVRTLRERDFVHAAELAGEPAWRILVVEILPNMTSLLVSAFIGASMYAIGAQVGLEFLGLGDLSAVTWGTNLYWASNDAALLTGSWWTFVPTGLGIAVTGAALALVNTGIDARTDPRLRAPMLAPFRRLGPGLHPTPVEPHRV